ncbi:helix-turn-helix domain-containing protein [Streptomyces sp. NPDC055189]
MSAAWQPLPEALPPEVRHFVEQLRLLKDRTGLSLIALGKETSYSKSSWQRYLNAQQPPPRQAVAALCRVAGADPERFGARWELAVRVWPRGEVVEEVAVVRSGSGSGVRSGGEPFRAELSRAELSRAEFSDAEFPGDEETLPWWELPAPAPPWRFVACSALVVVVLLLAVLLWVLAR